MATPRPEHLTEHHSDNLEHHADTKTAVEQKPQPDAAQPLEKPVMPEQAFEQYKQVNEDKPDESPYVIRQAQRKPTDDVMTDDTQKTPTQVEIENIMADGLGTAYQAMTPAQQEKFKKRGEEVAKAIDLLTSHLKLTARKVLHLIRSWLKLIPGINKYFLEQEAKLKTDDIMKYGREQMNKRRHQV